MIMKLSFTAGLLVLLALVGNDGAFASSVSIHSLVGVMLESGWNKQCTAAILIFSFLLAVYLQAVTGSIRGKSSGGRRLFPTTPCILWKKVTEYVEEGASRKEEKWCCEMVEGDYSHMVEIRNDSSADDDAALDSLIDAEGAISGEATFVASGSYVDVDAQVLSVPQGALVDINKTGPQPGSRRLYDVTSYGAKSTLVVRVNGDGVTPTSSLAELRNNVYTDTLNLKTQYALCSYNKMTIVPFDGTTSSGQAITDGAVEISISRNPNGSSNSQMEIGAKAAAASELGNLGNQFDLVLFCQPPGSGAWYAYAFINRWDSYYNDNACDRVNVQMHEM